MKVFADHGIEGRFERSRIVIRPYCWLSSSMPRLPGTSLLAGLAWGFRCWWTGLRSPEAGPYVTVGASQGFALAFLQLLASPFVRRRTHVLFDLLLERRRGGLSGLFDRAKAKIFCHSIDAAVVWGRADVELYAREHGLPKKKLHFHPFHITLEDYEFEIRDDGFIFAGGNHGRDYSTVIEALGQVDFPVFIATQAEGVAQMAKPYPHIQVRGVSHQEFRQKMAASTLVVEAHPREFFRTAGHQTFLNAMWMGKPFVMADLKSAEGYFEDGRHWFVVDHGDVEALRHRVRRLMEDTALATQMSEEARTAVRQPRYRTLNCMQEIYNLALEIDTRRRGGMEGTHRIDEY